jgi:hypothetical protein
MKHLKQGQVLAYDHSMTFSRQARRFNLCQIAEEALSIVQTKQALKPNMQP